MNEICIVSCDGVFARMLEIELKSLGSTVKTVTEKLNPPALKMAIGSPEILIWDASYYENNLSVTSTLGLKTVVFSWEPIDPLPENTAFFYERPFLITDFTNNVLSLMGIEKSISPQYTASDINIKLDIYSKHAEINGCTIKFSPKEFSLLSLLCKNRGRTVSRNEVIETVWGNDYDSKNNADNVYINYLRNKIDNRFGVKLIHTVRGKGYMMK